jgi:hypothetical protein
MFDPADDAYVRRDFRPFETVCGQRLAEVEAAIAAGQLARPTYTLDDGSRWVPAGYLLLADDAGSLAGVRQEFEERYVIASDMHNALAGPDELDVAWEEYLDGRLDAELVRATPEDAVTVSRLAAAIERLLDAPEPDEWRWRNRLWARSDHLAALTRPATAVDRALRDGELLRDLYVTAPRALWGNSRG